MAGRVAGEFQSLATDQLHEALRSLAAQAEHEASRLAIVAEALSYYADALAAAINVINDLVYFAQQLVRAREEADGAVQRLDRQIDAHRNERGWFSGFSGPDPEWQARLNDLTGKRNWAQQEPTGLNNRIGDIEAQLIAAHQKHTAAGDESASKIAGQYENAPSLPRAFWNSWRNDARDTVAALRTIRDHLTIEQWREFRRRVRRLGWREAIRVTAWDFVINGGLAASGTLLEAASALVKISEKGPAGILLDIADRGIQQFSIEQSERRPSAGNIAPGFHGNPPLLPPPTGVSDMLKGIGKSLKSQSLPKGRSEWDWRRQPQGNAAERPPAMSGGVSAAPPPAPRMAGGMGRTLPAGPDFDFNLPDGYMTVMLDGEERNYPELDAQIDALFGGDGADNDKFKSYMADVANAMSLHGASMYAVTTLKEDGYPPPITQILVHSIDEPLACFLEHQRDRGLQIMESTNEQSTMYRASHIELGKLTVEYTITVPNGRIYNITMTNKNVEMRRELLGYFDYLVERITPRAEIV